ncbi:MAG: tRNA (N(6)-L-threonylcarbamoyladenosine(37)-C(2))-methylthiotransferase MtaB [Rhodothermales bacterium]|nr:tRNA (N(6)-L-threonylcarbamoyladenosine(37)-C(2))-methylthiotransferase MtaB [Rhodothermales bacterium]
MPSVSFHTLGCKLNFAETGAVADRFRHREFDVVPFGEASDVVVLNTCTVTEQADRTCRKIIRRAHRANPDACVIATGCFAQLRPEQIAAIEGVDYVLGADEKFRLFEVVESFAKRRRTQVCVSCIDDARSFGPAFAAEERTRAFLKVQDGCDYTCSFCTIPRARGASRSATVDDVRTQALRIAERGCREIVLTGVNIGLFGTDSGTTLLALLKALDRVDGIERYRISSIEPNLLTDEIIDFVAASDRFASHFHVPLQSGDDFVLGKMRRRYLSDDYAERVAAIRSRIPDAAIGADVIVGFPAETPERFENTVRFLTALDVSYLHVFTYSERPGTVAVDRLIDAPVDPAQRPETGLLGGDGARLPASAVVDINPNAEFKPVPKHERAERNRRLRILSEKKRSAFYRAQIGTRRTVLWEDSERGGLLQGWTENYVRVTAPSTVTAPGSIQSGILRVDPATGEPTLDVDA